MIRYCMGLLAIVLFAGSQAYCGELDNEFPGKSAPVNKAVATPAHTQMTSLAPVKAGTEMDRETPSQAWGRGWGGGYRGWGGWGRGWGGWGYRGWGWPGYVAGFYAPYYAWPVYAYGYSPIVRAGWGYPGWCW